MAVVGQREGAIWGCDAKGWCGLGAKRCASSGNKVQKQKRQTEHNGPIYER